MRKSEVTLELKHRRSNPRNSEGAFVTLVDGRIMFAYSRYYGKSGSDNATADIAARYSADDGRTWSRKDRIVVKNEGRMNVMSVSLLRLQDGRIAMWYLRKNSTRDCRPYMRRSTDEGETWSAPVLCIPQRSYFVVNNDRVIQLRNGRLLIPAADHRARSGGDSTQATTHDSRAIALAFYSDDAGRTWTESRDWWALPVRSRSGLQEPGAVELSDGRLYAWARTDTGRQWEYASRDRGETWTPPRPSRFRSPCSPLCMKRIPSTGDLFVVWNDHNPKWKVRRDATTSWGRTPLAVAISSNDGKTWRKTKLVERDPQRGYCYTAIHFTDDAVLLAYCCGSHGRVLQDSCIRRLALDWVYA